MGSTFDKSNTCNASSRFLVLNPFFLIIILSLFSYVQQTNASKHGPLLDGKKPADCFSVK